MSKTIDFINNNFTPAEQKEFLSGLSNYEVKSLENDDLGSLSRNAYAVIQDKANSLALNPYQSRAQLFGKAHPILGHIAANFATAGTDLANSLRNFVGAPPDNTDYYNEYGVNKNLADKIAAPVIGFAASAPVGEFSVSNLLESKAAEYMPTLADSLGLAPQTVKNIAVAAGNALGGAATSPDDPSQGALTSMAGGAIGNAIFGSTPKAVKYVVKGLAGNSARNEMATQAAESLSDRLKDAPTLGDALKDSYKGQMDEFNAHQNAAEASARALDSHLGKSAIDLSPKMHDSNIDFLKQIQHELSSPNQALKLTISNLEKNGPTPASMQPIGSGHLDYLNDLADQTGHESETLGDAIKNIDQGAYRIPTIDFDSSPYRKVLNNFVTKFENSTPIEQSAMNDAHDFAQDQLKNGVIPQKFSDLIAQNRNLNASANNFFTKRYGIQKGVDKPTTDLISELKDGIQETFDINSKKMPTEQVQSVKDSFNNANKAYARAKSIARLPDSKGNPVPDDGFESILKSPNNIDDNVQKSISDSYVSKGSLGHDLLKSQVGEKQANDAIAKQVLINSGARPNSLDQLKTKDFVKIYSKMAPRVRNEVFNTDERNILDALEKSEAGNDFIKPSPRLASYVSGASPALLGGAVGGIEGYRQHGILGALAYGAGGAAAGMTLPKLLTNPKFLEWMYSRNEDPISLMHRLGGLTSSTINNNLEKK